MADTKINWADKVVNPIAGCTRVSPGCDNCYAANMSFRQEKMGTELYKGTAVWGSGRGVWTGKINFDPKPLEQIKRWKNKRIFMCSMSDWMHEKIHYLDIEYILDMMSDNPHNTFLTLTKRPKRLHEFKYPENCWLGVTVENQETANERIPYLLRTPAAVRFLSLEPLLGDVDIWKAIPGEYQCSKCGYIGDDVFIACRQCHELIEDTDVGCQMPYNKCGWQEFYDDADDAWEEVCPKCDQRYYGIDSGCEYNYRDDIDPESRLLTGINWVIIGCESGHNRRPCKIEWIEHIVEQCQSAGVPVWVKQIEINGKIIHDVTKFPKNLQLRELP